MWTADAQELFAMPLVPHLSSPWINDSAEATGLRTWQTDGQTNQRSGPHRLHEPGGPKFLSAWECPSSAATRP